MGEEAQKVLVMVHWREGRKQVEEREQHARVDFKQRYPPFFMQGDRLVNLFAMFSDSVSEMFKA